MLLLLMTNGRLSVVRIDDPSQFEGAVIDAHVVADLDGDPIRVLRDRRRRTPYLPDHRMLEAWLRKLAERLVD